MKILKLSLAAVLTLGLSNAVASSSLSEALTSGKFSGDIRFLHTQGNNSNVKAIAHSNDDTTSIGMRLGYVSGDFNGFKMGIVGQAGHDFKSHGEDGSNADDSRNTVSGYEIQELYLDYAFSKNNIRIGRQTINTPLISNSEEFPLEDSFDAITLSSKELANTNIHLAYIDQWNKRFNHDSNGSATQEDFEYEDGLYSVYVVNKSFKPLKLEAQYIKSNQEGVNGNPPVNITDGYSQYFLRSDYKLPTSHPLTFGTMYSKASFDEELHGVDEAYIYGFKLGTKIAKVNFVASYTSVSDDRDYPGTLGHTPDKMSYTNTLNAKTFFAGVDAYSLQASYKFSPKLSTRIKYTHLEQSKESFKYSVKDFGQADEINLDIKYDLSSILKGLSTRFFLSYTDCDDYIVNSSGEGSEQFYGRYYLSYKF